VTCFEAGKVNVWERKGGILTNTHTHTHARACPIKLGGLNLVT
jgi:hypothetical protein